MTQPCDVRFLHVPKLSNYYKPIDDFMFINLIPMGVFAMAARLVEKGIASRILHAGVERLREPGRDLVEQVLAGSPRIVGLSLHWHFQSWDVMEVVKAIKQRDPSVFIVLGGFTASRFADELIAEWPSVDGVVEGDGEQPILQLAEKVIAGERDLSAIPNLIWRREGRPVRNPHRYVADQAAIDALDFARIDLLDHWEVYQECFSMPLFWMNHATLLENKKFQSADAPVFPLCVGRGCRVDCSFCGGSQSNMKRICGRAEPLFRSPSAVMSTIRAAAEYGYRTVLVSFDPTPIDDDYWIELFSLIRKSGVPIEMNFECWGIPTYRFLVAFKSTFHGNCSTLALSPETGSEALRAKNKGLTYTNQELFQRLDWLKALDIGTDVFFTVGLPGETPSELEETRQLFKRINREYGSVIRKVIMVPVQMEPGSPMFEDSSRFGISTSRKTFMDFYLAHGQTDSGPFSCMGYTSDQFTGKTLSEAEFSQEVLATRCRDFCLIAPRILGNFVVQPLGRTMCHLKHRSWRKLAHGAPRKARASFV